MSVFVALAVINNVNNSVNINSNQCIYRVYEWYSKKFRKQNKFINY